MKLIGMASALIGLAACSQQPANQQVASENQASEAVNAGNSDAASGPQPTATPANELSTGMPVPGTNAPEHVVVNEDVANNSQ